MFEFLFDIENYEDRKVGRDDFPWGFISTAKVSDGNRPYETAVAHDKYRDDGRLVIVEAYNTKQAAIKGHDKWIKTMTSKKLPKTLTDCQNAGVSAFLDSKDLVYPLRKGKRG